ncbi:MAG: lipoyl synthase [Neisseriales bacterium]|jgi:lipoic acid synthetase|nr:MAG: lipoyl synthase [Neisseriales bacterium]
MINTEDKKQGVKLRNEDKLSRIPIKVVPLAEPLKKPEWIKVKLPTGENFNRVKNLLREHKLHTVCEEASCPNIGECFDKGTATFMIMGDICTRRCPFCDVGHGKPNPLDVNEPKEVARSVDILKLKYVVITSVDRDDLRDGGAEHFVHCIQEIRAIRPQTKIEILVPDFRGRLDKALEVLAACPPDVLNHNLETVPRLYKAQRPGADLQNSLDLLKRFKQMRPDIPTKSGIMVGIGETNEEIKELMLLMREHDIEMITIGQYLQPSKHHSPVLRYVTPAEFKELEDFAYQIGFKHAAVGALVRSSYHADQQAHNAGVEY